MKHPSAKSLLAFAIALLLATASISRGADAPKGSLHPSAASKPVDLPTLAKVPFEQALHTAVARVPGNVIKAELEVEDGCLMYSFEIVDAHKSVIEVEIDAGNGTVLDTENESAESGAEEPGK